MAIEIKPAGKSIIIAINHSYGKDATKIKVPPGTEIEIEDKGMIIKGKAESLAK